MRTVKAVPSAAMLVESMRDIGYSLETALADVVDNSVTAGAGSIRVFVSTGPSAIAILDDGCGMTEAELFKAMQLGCRSPRDDRASSDLGRFGLGLKTASFSQCRRLTVVTRKAEKTSVARWDLDYVAVTDDWLVQVPSTPDVPWADQLGQHGTLVLWEDLDRLVESSGDKADEEHFVKRMDDACRHLELVFHRFLAGRSSLPRITIHVNDRPLVPYDPFARSHPATIIGPKETIRVGGADINVQAHTLPHHQHLNQSEWEHQGGDGGHVKNQGFYVYREGRLILHGTWFGLARQTELTKLSRVQVDIPNTLDTQWKIDVRKASAQLPLSVRTRLKRIVEPIVATSKRVYRSRGTRMIEDTRIPMWNRIQGKEHIAYWVNHSHPIISELMNRMPAQLKDDFENVLEIIASTLPFDALYADMGADPGRLASDGASEAAFVHAARTTLAQLVAGGIGEAEALEMMSTAEPFKSRWSQTLELLTVASCNEAT